jgi:hypothetical protein
MSTIEWLCANAPGFSDLSEEERTAIMHFSVLWSFFEARLLKTNASAKSILTLVRDWTDRGQLDLTHFEESLDYFKDRYFKDDVATGYFAGLNIRKNDNPTLVNAVLKGENTNPSDCVAALLIVVFRLRNNLFHGAKWVDGIRGQRDNFIHASTALMVAIETCGNL